MRLDTKSCNPIIGIVIPCYRQAAYLTDSVNSALRQTYGDVEVVIVDDGSPDNTLEVADGLMKADSRVRYVRQPNSGLSAARNAGFNAASNACEAFLFLDADDVLEPDALERLERALCEQSVSAAHGVPRFIGADGTPVTDGNAEAWARARRAVRGNKLEAISPSKNTTFDVLAFQNCIATPGQVLIRRSALDKVGLFDVVNSPTADWDMWLRLTENGSIAFVDHVVLGYRRHGANMSSKERLMRASDIQLRLRTRDRIRDVDLRKVMDTGFRLSERSLATMWCSLAVERLGKGHIIWWAKMMRRAMLYYAGFLTGYPFWRGGRKLEEIKLSS